MGNLFVKILSIFVKPDDNLILFVSYGGRKFDDSPKYIYDMILKDDRFCSFKLVWAFIVPSDYQVTRGTKIRIDSLQYFVTALKARCWVTNSSILRGLSFKGKNTFYLNTWHGTAIKKMGSDLDKTNKSFSTKNKKNLVDIMNAQGVYDAQLFSRVFNIPYENFRIVGLPRNDELFKKNGKQYQEIIKEKLGIAKEKKVILYAPTFREYVKDRGNNCYFAPPMHLDKWEKMLASDYVMLFRAHYEVVNTMNIVDSSFVKEVSNYTNLNELMIASDILLSDYSSIYFDYAIQDKPMMCFAYDYDQYNKERGLYFDIREVLGDVDLNNEDRVIKELLNINVEERIERTRSFRAKYIQAYGSATEKTVDIIAKNIVSKE